MRTGRCRYEATIVSRKGRNSLPLQQFTRTDQPNGSEPNHAASVTRKARFEIRLQHRRFSFIAPFAEKRERPATLWNYETEQHVTALKKARTPSPAYRHYPYTHQPCRENHEMNIRLYDRNRTSMRTLLDQPPSVWCR
jgi:hypothetical protein